MKFEQNDLQTHSFRLKKLQDTSANRAGNITDCCQSSFLVKGTGSV
jgi:hypothetical protein